MPPVVDTPGALKFASGKPDGLPRRQCPWGLVNVVHIRVCLCVSVSLSLSVRARAGRGGAATAIL